MSQAPYSFELGKNRIEALSDGIFAIVMTLLILELRVPELPHNAPNAEVWPAILKLWPKLVSYAAAFASLGVFWIAHHNMYHAVRRSNRVLLYLNILFFMVVSFVPFSTSVLNDFRQSQVGPVFFGANMALIGWTLWAQWVYVCSQPEMLGPHATPEYRALIRARFFCIPLVLSFTVLVCFWSMEISLAVYLLTLPFYLIPARIAPAGEQGVEPVMRLQEASGE
jgi:uncharacterized membrane protein